MSSQPSAIPRFSAAIEGWWIHCWRRLTAASWRFSTCASTGARPGSPGGDDRIRAGIARVAAPAAAPWRKVLLFMLEVYPEPDAIPAREGQASPLRHEGH